MRKIINELFGSCFSRREEIKQEIKPPLVLPIEIIASIFNYLTSADQLQAIKVCKRWRQAASLNAFNNLLFVESVLSQAKMIYPYRRPPVPFLSLKHLALPVPDRLFKALCVQQLASIFRANALVDYKEKKSIEPASLTACVYQDIRAMTALPKTYEIFWKEVVFAGSIKSSITSIKSSLITDKRTAFCLHDVMKNWKAWRFQADRQNQERDYFFSALEIKWLADCLSQAKTQLTVIDLSFIGVNNSSITLCQPKALAVLLKALEKLPYLDHLDLRGIAFQDAISIEAFIDFLQNNKKASSVYMTTNLLSDQANHSIEYTVKVKIKGRNSLAIHTFLPASLEQENRKPIEL